MKDGKSGWLANAVKVESPNFNARPDGEDVSLLVIHNISLPPGQFGGGYIERFFQNDLPVGEHPYFQTIAELQVSAHFLIKRSGEVIQFVPLDKRAWHAGISIYEGRENCNDFSVGIELEGTDDVPYTELQYQSLGHLVAEIRRVFPAITPERIVGHSDIAPGRKTDPGAAFDWSYFWGLLDS